MTKLFVGTALPHLHKALPVQEFDNFAWLENRDGAHFSGDLNLPDTNELGFQLRLAVLEEHRNYFAKILFHLVHIRTLRVGTRPPRNVPDI